MYETLSFPLNVYASLLQLDHKPVDYLHFGLFQSPDEDVYAAQKHSTEKVLQHLPKAPANILEIGMGLGTMQKILLEKGYNAQGLTPDHPQYEIALKTIGCKANIHCSSFEDFRTTERFDAVITQESAQYIDIINLLPKASQLLKPGGCFILIDEVSLSPEPGDETLHNPDHLRFLAQCVNLKISHEEDLSECAQYTMEYLKNRLSVHYESILHLLDNNKVQLNELENAINQYIKNYQQHRYGYRLMVFEKTRDSQSDIKYLNQSHFAQFQRLFTDAFKQPIASELWRWKYQREPSHSIGYWQDAELSGHYGGFVRDILFFGQPQQALQIGDTMVAQKEQGRLTKNGIFHQLARVFLHRFIGYGAPYSLGFGFPNSRVMKLAKTLNLYDSAGRITRLSWSPKPIKAHPIYKLRHLSGNEPEMVNSLWKQMARDTSHYIIGVRDWKRIHYRYLDHPEHPYVVLKLCHRLTNKAIAILILRHEDSLCHLVDFVCRPKHIPQMLRAAIRYSWQQHQSELFTLISENLKPIFNHYSYVEDDPQISIPHSACTTGPRLTEVKNKWWLMAGDSDFM